MSPPKPTEFETLVKSTVLAVIIVLPTNIMLAHADNTPESDCQPGLWDRITLTAVEFKMATSECLQQTSLGMKVKKLNDDYDNNRQGDADYRRIRKQLFESQNGIGMLTTINGQEAKVNPIIRSSTIPTAESYTTIPQN